MSADIPDWLRGLAPKEEGEEEEAAVGFAPPPPVMKEPEVEAEAPGLDLMADLRTQMSDVADEPTAADLARAEPRRRARASSGLALNLRPWQQFILSVLLFLDVAVIGLLFLVMLGRIVIPAL